ncbi:hypothetical protein HPB52_003856 [Rhipicephalus sanguineus]|uniref:Uncharacterized protein n=1 Tax=Rhipicephalus sanguineus TaxID=34632 RepID=A0A9D4Q8X3_RHISA|nr:hypothetical protein HPB52_003856 [Rhipicephalus sanguineus]
MNCTKTKFECVKVKNLETRCHSYRGPYCSQDEICAYEKTDLKCLFNCTCYGLYKAVCTRKLAQDPCTDGSLATVTPGVAGYKCDRCLSESEDADCTNNTKCVAHRNYGKDSTCETHKYCLILDNLETRCGGSKAPKCALNEYCAYGFVALSCNKCPCYGSHQATCIRKLYKNLCSPDSIVRLDKEMGYTCDSCITAASVLTGMT